MFTISWQKNTSHPDGIRTHDSKISRKIDFTATKSHLKTETRADLNSSSVTRHLTEKCAQFCQKIAQNGALVNKNFYPKKYSVKFREF
jgi:hypothetical protein